MKVYGSISITKVNDGTNGTNGTSITSVTSQYCISTSNTIAPTTDWTDNLSAINWEPSKYIWYREKIAYSDGSYSYTIPSIDKSLSLVGQWCSEKDKTCIDGGKIFTGSITSKQLSTDAITSNNYVKDSSGSKLDLANGSFDSKCLKLNQDGGTIGSWNIDDTSLYGGTLWNGEVTNNRDYYVKLMIPGTVNSIDYYFVAESGMKTSNGVTDHKHFVVRTDGSIGATAGNIGGINLSANSLYIGHSGVGILKKTFRGNLNNNRNDTYTISDWGDANAWHNYVYWIPGNNGVEETLRIILDGNNYNDEYFLVHNEPNGGGTFSLELHQKDSKCDMDGAGNDNGWWLIHNTSSESSSAPIFYRNNQNSFSISSDGTIVANNAKIFGHIEAISGSFSGSLSAATGSFAGNLSISKQYNGNIAWTKLQTNRSSINFFVENSGSESITIASDVGYLKGTWVNDSSYATNSDFNLKYEIETIPSQYLNFLDNLIPVRYKYNDGTSDRYHTGFIAQEVGEALTAANIDSKDFAGLVILNQGEENERWTLRYEEFIALNTAAIQKLKARVTELENIVAKLQQKEE